MPLFRLIYSRGSAVRGITAWAEDARAFKALVQPLVPAEAKIEATLPVIARQGSAEKTLERLRQSFPLLYTQRELT